MSWGGRASSGASTVAAAYSVPMPSSPSAARRMLAALLTVLVIASSVSGQRPGNTLLPAAQAALQREPVSPARPRRGRTGDHGPRLIDPHLPRPRRHAAGRGRGDQCLLQNR